MVVSPVRALTPREATEKQLVSEYVAGGAMAWYGNARVDLPWIIDDLKPEVIDKMLWDSQVSACINIFKAAVIEDGIRLGPAVVDPEKPGFKKAKRIKEAADSMLARLDPNLDDVLWNMMDCVCYGNKVAEVNYELQDGELNVKSIKVKPRTSVAFVVDQFLNIIGLLRTTHGGIVASIPDQKDILPREKFLIMMFRPKDSDPRGTSLLKAAYRPWWRKVQLDPDYMKFMSQFAGPSVLGFTPEGAKLDAEKWPADDPEGVPTTPAQAMLRRLVQWRNGSAAVFPHGAQVDVVKSEGDGKAFLNAFDFSNWEITKSILTQSMATEESQNMARAAATVHQDMFDTLVRQGKRSVAMSFERDVLRNWVRYNFGEESLKYVPRVTLGDIEHRQLSQLMTAIANLKRSGYLSDDQLPYVDRLLGLPVREKPAPMLVTMPPPAQGADPNQTPTDGESDDDDDNSDSEDRGGETQPSNVRQIQRRRAGQRADADTDVDGYQPFDLPRSSDAAAVLAATLPILN